MNQKKIIKKVFTNPIYFVAFGFGSGLLPKAPGTWGTVMAIPIYWFMASSLNLIQYAICTFVALILGIWICDWVSRDLKIHDFSGIVWDEMVGYWITLFAVPKSWIAVVLGFGLFRLFDIWKPFPIRWLDKHVKGGLGIMVDDVLAAVYAAFVMQIILKFTSFLF